MGQYTDLIAHDATYSLHDALDSSRSDYREDFYDYWGLTASEPPDTVEKEEWLELRQLYGLAQQVANVASSLIKHKGIGSKRLSEADTLAQDARSLQDKIDQALETIRERLGTDAWTKAYWTLLPQTAADPRTRNAIFRNSLEIECANLFLPNLGAVASRLETLTKHLVSSQNLRTNAYLSLVARSYCLDHRTELAIMCRAALDTALQDVASDESVIAKLGGRGNERVGLEKRIDYLESFDLVSPKQVASMKRVKKSGDDAAHLTPGVEPASDLLLGDLVSGLSAVDGLRARLKPDASR